LCGASAKGGDLATIPHLDRVAPWFAFLVHPRDDDDLDSLGPSSVLRRYSAPGEFHRRAFAMGPLVIGEVSFGFSSIKGELIGVACPSDEMMTRRGRAAVLASVRTAVARGARVIGLGALTAPATGGGAMLVRDLPPGVTVTNGSAYTAAVVWRQVLSAARTWPEGSRVVTGIVGCTGSVGAPATRLIAAASLPLVLVGRTIERVRTVIPDVTSAVRTQDLGDLRCCDIVVLLTHEHSALLRPVHVKPGALVIDYAQPPNVDAETRAEFARQGVAVVRGGTVSIPGYRASCELVEGEPDATFACLAETYLCARHGLPGHGTGRPSVERALNLDRLARRDGLRPAAITSDEASGVGV
jgi:fatty aldehyde-generating acyl-ACP reductase